MRIISKFKDYYDGGAVYGVDEKLTYVRDTRVEELELRRMTNKDRPLNLGQFDIVGFCGKIYIAKFNRWRKKKLRNGETINQEFDLKTDAYWGDDSLDWAISNIYSRRRSETEFVKRKRNETSWDETEEQIYDGIMNSKLINGLFLKHRTPIFHIPYVWEFEDDHFYTRGRSKNARVIVNPCLKDIGFPRVKDTTQAFQEISMFLGSVMVKDTEVDVPVGDDEVVGKSKGFDKWSFRKQGKTSKEPKKF